MARQNVWGLAAVLLVASAVCFAQAQTADLSGDVLAAAQTVSDSNNKDGQVLGAAVEQLTSRINDTVSGLQERAGPIVEAAGGKGGLLDKVVFGPVRDTAGSILRSITVVREAAEVSLTNFFGLFLDNTKELRKTLEDGNLFIDLIRTLRGAKCDAASFEPPSFKPARLNGPAGTVALTTGACTLRRAAKPSSQEYSLKCDQPSITFESLAPRYTSRFVGAAVSTSEECKVERKYGVEAEIWVTLFNPADFFKKAEDAADVEVVKRESVGPFGVNRAAGWFNTLFPLSGSNMVEFVPVAAIEAIDKAIKSTQINLGLEYKPFNIRQDLVKQAFDVADVLSARFEVDNKLYKVWRDDLRDWVDPEKRAEMLDAANVDFGDNLRDVMAKYNISSLFDGAFTKTASHLISKTPLGGKVIDAADHLLTERPLRTLLARAREGVGRPVTYALEGGLDTAVEKTLDAIRAATGAGDWSDVLPKVPRKGSLMERLLKDKGTRGYMKELQTIFTDMGDLSSRLGRRRESDATATTDATASTDSATTTTASAQSASTATIASADSASTTTTASADSAAGAAAGTNQESTAAAGAAAAAADAVSGDVKP